MKRPWILVSVGIALVIGGISLLLVLTFGAGPPLVVSKETTWLTGPLAEDGLPDYASDALARARQGVTPENNAAVPLLQAMWPADVEPEYWEVLCTELGIEQPKASGFLPAMEDEKLELACRQWLKARKAKTAAAASDAQDSESEGESEGMPEAEAEIDMWQLVAVGIQFPWRAEEMPPLAAWLKSRQAKLDLLQSGAARSHFYAPGPALLVEPTTPFSSHCDFLASQVESAGETLALRGMWRVAEDDLPGAWADCVAIHRLAQHAWQNSAYDEFWPTLLDTNAHQLAQAILDSPQLSPELARQMLEFYSQRAPRRSVAAAVDQRSRLQFLTAVLAASGERRFRQSRSDLVYDDDQLDWMMLHSGVDWNEALKVGNKWYDRLRAAQSLSGQARSDALMQLDFDYHRLYGASESAAAGITAAARGRLWGELLIYSLESAPEDLCWVEESLATRWQLHHVAAALAVHRLEQGEYPAGLDELVPAILPTAPVDSFGARPLVYQRTNDGYLLYSLGSDGTDQGGSNGMEWIYQGYSCESEEYTDVRTRLGLPPAEPPSSEEEDLASGATAGDPAKMSVYEMIPGHADDLGLRFPLAQRIIPLGDDPYE